MMADLSCDFCGQGLGGTHYRMGHTTLVAGEMVSHEICSKCRNRIEEGAQCIKCANLFPEFTDDLDFFDANTEIDG